MPDISKITLPSGTTYDIKDVGARELIENLSGLDTVIFQGVSSTALTDGGTEKPTVGSSQQTPKAGYLYFYGTYEYIWGKDSKWHELGSLEMLGDLAYKDEASVSYQPAGTVSKPTFTGSQSQVTITTAANASGNYQPGGTVTAPTITLKTGGSTATLKNPTGTTVATAVVAAAPGTTAPANSFVYYSVQNETLSLYQIGYNTGNSITTENVTVKTGDGTYQASAPTFTGNKVQISGTTTAAGSVSQPTFTGTTATITVS